MEIKLTSVSKNIYPICGFFIEGQNLSSWITSLETIDIQIQSVEIHPLPSNTANINWGCLVLVDNKNLPSNIGRFEAAINIEERLIIPEYTKIVPRLSQHDLDTLLRSDRYVMHNDFGWFKITDPLSLSEHINLNINDATSITSPLPHQTLSNDIKCFRIEAKPKEEVKKEIEKEFKQKREKLKSNPLSLLEKVRLKAYQQVLKLDKDKNGKTVVTGLEENNLIPLSKLLGNIGTDNIDKIKNDFEDLTERNKKEVDKLLDMLKNDPERALRYAIPLDEHGHSRGGNNEAFRLQDRNYNFSLLGFLGGLTGVGRAEGGSVDLGQEFFRLQNQYRTTAIELADQGNYEKAAFIYMKLLKDYPAAGNTLRIGKKFEQAALIYQDYAKDEIKAAECYEEGKMYDKAIELFEKNEKFEKAGDLYSILGNQNSANGAFQKVIDKYLKNSKHFKASIVSKNKMNNFAKAQEILLTGWDSKVDQFNCLNNYFKNIGEPDKIWKAIENVKSNNVDIENEKIFLTVLKYEFKKESDIQANVQNLAYEMISKMLQTGSISSNEILAFNPNDSRLANDSMRYQLGRGKKM